MVDVYRTRGSPSMGPKQINLFSELLRYIKSISECDRGH